MNDHLVYFDRNAGKLKKEQVYAGAFLDWAYNSGPGIIMTNLLLRHRWVSWLYGWLHKRPASKRMIRPFISRMKIDMHDSVKSIDQFTSFNDFFCRHINLSTRPIDNHCSSCAAPADGKVLAYPTVSKASRFMIKRHLYDMQSFLVDPCLAAQFDGGSMVVSRLHLGDYHHFHFPDSGVADQARVIPGRYYASGPYSLRRIIPYYGENFRMHTQFESDHFGPMLIVEIGAFTVGSIKQEYQPGRELEKGDHKGYFELGGSTVVLLFQKDTIVLDADLVDRTRLGIETFVRLGDSIGKASSDTRRHSAKIKGGGAAS